MSKFPALPEITSVDHKFLSENSFNPFPCIHGATLLRYMHKVSALPGITSTKHEFPDRKQFQFQMHPLFSPILLLMIQALALACNFSAANKAQIQQVNKPYNISCNTDYDYGGSGDDDDDNGTVHKINNMRS
jgi:hypothetical protein